MFRFDARDYPAADRVDAVRSVLGESWVSEVVFHERPQNVTFQIEIASLGSATITRTVSNGLTVKLQPTEKAVALAPSLALQLHEGATGRFAQGERHQALGASQMLLNDLTRPYEFGWSGNAESRAVVLDLRSPGLSPEQLHDFDSRHLDGPVGRMLVNHVRYVAHNAVTLAADIVSSDAATGAINTLLEALVVGGEIETSRRAEARRSTGLIRALDFIRRNLKDASLSSAAVAAALHLTGEQLDDLASTAGMDLQAWTHHRRLEGARSDLADRSQSGRSVRSIGLSWGFETPTAFDAAFEDHYAISPAEWRRFSRGDWRPGRA